jgi:hypothetical protein
MPGEPGLFAVLPWSRPVFLQLQVGQQGLPPALAEAVLASASVAASASGASPAGRHRAGAPADLDPA